jgi:hypothetical protein
MAGVVSLRRALDGGALDFAGRVLWGDDVAALEPVSDRRAAGWFAFTSAAGSTLLLPAGPARGRRRSLLRYHDGQGLAERAARTAAAFALGWAPAVSSVPVAETSGPSPVIGAILDCFGGEGRTAAVTLGPPRANRKAVVAVLDAAGVVLGYAKVAHDATTRRLVANEQAWLTRLDGRAGRLRTPRLLASVEMAGRHLVVLDALASSPLGRRRVDELTDLANEVHQACGPPATEALGGSAWADAVRAVVSNDSARSLLAHWADRPVAVGPGHGDLSPWNVVRARGVVGLLDWEYALDGVPCGLDALRGETQVALHLLGSDPAPALVRSAGAAAVLAGSGRMGGWSGPDLFRLHLLDLLRHGADPSAGPRERALAAAAIRLDRSGVSLRPAR